jgi:hypothetical protein
MAEEHPVLASLLYANAQWASDVNKAEPGFFARAAEGQSLKVNTGSFLSRHSELEL